MTYKVPTGWIEIGLGDIIGLQIDNRGRNPANYVSYSKYPVIDNYLIRNTRYPNLLNVNRYIDQETFDNFLRDYVEKDDVLITLVGNGIGNVTMVPDSTSVIIQNTLGLRTNEKAKDVFLYYLLLYNQEKIKNFDRGSSQPSIRKTDLFKLNINLPPLEEQKRIANILSTIDDKIENNKRINKNLEAQAQALFKHWFVDFEFLNEDGNPYKSSEGIFKESELDQIPASWEIKLLKEELSFIRGIEPGAKNYQKKATNSTSPFYRVGEMLNETAIFVDKELLKDRIAGKNDVLVSFDGTVGRAVTGLSGGYSSGIRKIYSKGGYYPNSFIYFLFKSQHIQNYIHQHATGTTILHASKSIDYMKIPYNEKVVKEYCKLSDVFLEKIIKNKLENEALLSIRDTLLPKLMSGEIRIPLDD